ncbi:MAG: methylenetetrahydrofolate reductase [NAD(P)H] [Anaeroplasmataceae bacterium]
MKISEILKNKKTLSFEVFPPKKENVDDINKLFNTIDLLKELNPDFISVTYGAGGNNTKNTVMIADYIKNKANIEALAHLTGGPSNEEIVLEILAELKNKNIDNIMSLRGDKPKDLDIEYCKHFKHATDLNEFINNSGYDFCLGGACYPEGHPESSRLYDDLLNLKKKQDSGADFLISQVFYDNNYFYRLLREARKIGITVPIIPGIMPLTTERQINNIINMTGSSVPLTLRSMIERFKDDKEAIREIGINYAVSQILDLLANDVDGIHLYIMNNFKNASDIYYKISHILKKEMK